MLRRLHIRNYLLIEELDLPLHDGLTIITGETGSGKSILIGALALAMGERAEAGVARDAQQRCVVELEIDLCGVAVVDWFDRHELPYEERSILRRQIEPGGRSRAFINDTPVRIELLRELGSRMVHVHSQHHTLLLNDAHFQLGLVDHVALTGSLVANYVSAYAEWRLRAKELQTLKEQEAQLRAEQDFLRYQWNELTQASLVPDELARITTDLSRAEHADEIRSALLLFGNALSNDAGLLDQLATARQHLAKAARIDPTMEVVLERVRTTEIELKDLADEAANRAGAVELDPADLERLRVRSDELGRLLRKYHKEQVEELIALRDSLAARLTTIDSLDDRLRVVEQDEQRSANEVRVTGKALSQARTSALVPLGDRIALILHDLGLPDARVTFDHRRVEPGPHGMDAVRVMFSANKDRPPSTLDKVASGGELSRLMLALISLTADSQGTRSVIFDEIDTGVSGEVADRVGALMARMGKDRQILAITHLPQIASKGDHHLLVSKGEIEGQVRTRLTSLTGTERVQAIAQMLSGRKVTKQALENARVLLNTAK